MCRWIVFGLVGLIGGCSEPCETRVAKIEARLTDENAQLAMLRRIDHRLDQYGVAYEQRKLLPLATKPESHFAPGVAFGVGTTPAERAAFETAIADLACVKRERPLRIYLVGASAVEQELLAGYASWLAAASAAWKVPIEVRRVVRLAEEADLFPWPEGSEVGQALAKEVFAKESEPDRDRLVDALRLATFGCPAIAEAAGNGEGGEKIFSLTSGLRDCGCMVPNMDFTVGIWHLMQLTRTDVRWEAIASPAADRAIAPLACVAKPVTVLRRSDDWEMPPAKLETFVATAVARIEDCRQRDPRTEPGIVQVRVSHSLSSYEMTALDDNGDFYGDCAREHLENGGDPRDLTLDGTTRLEVYVPAGAGSAAPEQP